MGVGDGFDLQRSLALHALDWLREAHPDARVTVEMIPSDDALIPVRVQIETSNGAVGSGHGTAAGIEEAEDRAIVRAAETLGFRGSIRDGGIDPVPQDDPAPQLPPFEPDQPAQPSAPQPRAGRSGHLGPAVVTRPRSHSGSSGTTPPQERPPDVPAIDDSVETEMEDISWTAFWTWARGQGFETGDAVARAIGRPIQGLTPREVRELLRSSI